MKFSSRLILCASSLHLSKNDPTIFSMRTAAWTTWRPYTLRWSSFLMCCLCSKCTQSPKTRKLSSLLSPPSLSTSSSSTEKTVIFHHLLSLPAAVPLRRRSSFTTFSLYQQQFHWEDGHLSPSSLSTSSSSTEKTVIFHHLLSLPAAVPLRRRSSFTIFSLYQQQFHWEDGHPVDTRTLQHQPRA